MTDSLFDSIRDMLGESEAPQQQADTSKPHGMGAEILHPYMQLDDSGVPVVIASIFQTYFPADQYEAMAEEAKLAHADMMAMFAHMNEGDMSDQREALLAKMLIGNLDSSDPTAGVRWLARFVMCAPLLAGVSLVKGLIPSKHGVFADSFEYRTAFAASSILDVAVAIASPIRAEWAVLTDLFGKGNA